MPKARQPAHVVGRANCLIKGTAFEVLEAYRLKIERVTGLNLKHGQVASLLIMAGSKQPLGEVFTSLEQLEEGDEDDEG